MLSSSHGYLRRITAMCVLFGVLFAPAEMSIPDRHDGSNFRLVSAHVAPASVVHQVCSASPDVAGSDERTVDAGIHWHAEHTDQGDSGKGSHGTYDHCTHSHLTSLVHATTLAAVDGAVYVAFRIIPEYPASVASSPHTRPPIA